MTTQRRFWLTATAAVLFALPAAAGVLNHGKWEITLRTVAPLETPPMVSEVCISKEDVGLPRVPRGRKNGDCQIAGGLQGNSLKYVKKCTRAKTTTTVEFTYLGDTYEGVVTIKTEQGETKQVYSARRLGECDTPDE